MNHLDLYEATDIRARRLAFAALSETCPHIKALFDELKRNIGAAIDETDNSYDLMVMINDLLIFTMTEIIEDVTSPLRLAQIEAYEKLIECQESEPQP